MIIELVKGVNLSQKYSRLALAILPEILQLAKIADINYEMLKKSFDKLENDLGDINIIWTFERLNDPYKSINYYYLLEESVHKFVKYMGLQPKSTIADQLLNIPKTITNVLADLTHLTLVGSKEDMLSLYCRLWETYFNILMGQIYYKLKKDTKKGKYYQVEEVKEFLRKNIEYQAIFKLIMPINTNLRNAITHLNYYINNQEEKIYYHYVVNKERKIERIALDELENAVKMLIIGNFMLILLMGDKMKQKISLELVDKIKELLIK